MSRLPTSCVDVFLSCHRAVRTGKLITRAHRSDKEFPFQDWFKARLDEAGIAHDQHGRNSYPDFTIVRAPEGYELKALAFPGRAASYDSNSQVPTGFHNDRTIFYVFGRYPRSASETEFPVVDLVVCHGSFLNAHHEYVHENKSVRGFGSYGDLLIRDRKMYVAPTPFALTQGTAGQHTLIVPEDVEIDDRVEQVGLLTRVEADYLVVGYSFDLISNDLTARTIPNPHVGRVHRFVAYRVRGEIDPPVTLVATSPQDVLVESESDDD